MNIDIHSHVIPTQFWNASDKGQSWFGAKLVKKEGNSYVDTMNRLPDLLNLTGASAWMTG